MDVGKLSFLSLCCMGGSGGRDAGFVTWLAAAGWGGVVTHVGDANRVRGLKL